MRTEAEAPSAAAVGSAVVVDDRFSNAQEDEAHVPSNGAAAHEERPAQEGSVVPLVDEEEDDSEDDWDEEDEDVIGAMAWVDFREGALSRLWRCRSVAADTALVAIGNRHAGPRLQRQRGRQHVAPQRQRRPHSR